MKAILIPIVALAFFGLTFSPEIHDAALSLVTGAAQFHAMLN